MKITHRANGKDGLTAALRIALTALETLETNAASRAGGKYGKPAPVEAATTTKIMENANAQ